LPFKEDEYGRFCKRSHGLLPCYLPEYQGAANIVGSRLRAMLYFDRDWTPHIQKLGVPFSLSLTPLVMAVKRALRPVIERLPSETMQTPVRRRSGFEFLRTIPAIVLVLFGLPELSGYAHLRLRASAVAHNDHGAALYEQHDLDGAIRELEQALRLNPDLVSAHVNLGMAWYEKGDLERALAAYDTALRVDPNVALLHNNLGLALRKKGDLNGAIAEFRRAARLEPTLTVAQDCIRPQPSGQARRGARRTHSGLQAGARRSDDPAHLSADHRAVNHTRTDRAAARTLESPKLDQIGRVSELAGAP
jgi:tetratricopeptide (TPR) repeat protein